MPREKGKAENSLQPAVFQKEVSHSSNTLSDDLAGITGVQRRITDTLLNMNLKVRPQRWLERGQWTSLFAFPMWPILLFFSLLLFLNWPIEDGRLGLECQGLRVCALILIMWLAESLFLCPVGLWAPGVSVNLSVHNVLMLPGTSTSDSDSGIETSSS